MKVYKLFCLGCGIAVCCVVAVVGTGCCVFLRRPFAFWFLIKIVHISLVVIILSPSGICLSAGFLFRCSPPWRDSKQGDLHCLLLEFWAQRENIKPAVLGDSSSVKQVRNYAVAYPLVHRADRYSQAAAGKLRSAHVENCSLYCLAPVVHFRSSSPVKNGDFSFT